MPDWTTEPIPDDGEENAFTEIRPGLWYDPARLSDPAAAEKAVALCRRFGRKLPVETVRQQGYLISVFEDEAKYTLHFLAAAYDTDIDHHLDEIRFHRSRVNLVTRAEPTGVEREIRFAGGNRPAVFTPFLEGKAEVAATENGWRVILPEGCAYAIFAFPKDR